MRTSGRKTEPSSPEAGFTLVEVMTALLIASMLAGAVLLLWPGQNMTVRDTAERLAARLEAAADESVLLNRQIALVVTAEGYGFERREADGWRRLESGHALAFQAWPASSDAQIEAPSPTERSGDHVAVLDPLGGATPMRVVIGDAVRWSVEIDKEGAVHVDRAS